MVTRSDIHYIYIHREGEGREKEKKEREKGGRGKEKGVRGGGVAGAFELCVIHTTQTFLI